MFAVGRITVAVALTGVLGVASGCANFRIDVIVEPGDYEEETWTVRLIAWELSAGEDLIATTEAEVSAFDFFGFGDNVFRLVHAAPETEQVDVAVLALDPSGQIIATATASVPREQGRVEVFLVLGPPVFVGNDAATDAGSVADSGP